MASIARCTRRITSSPSYRASVSSYLLTARCYSSKSTSTIRPLAHHSFAKSIPHRTRNFSKVASRSAAVQTQEAPNAQAYLNSGAIAGARDLVDVKEVLVIGSGGLSIGQAGEFDYSGEPILDTLVNVGGVLL